MRNELYGNASFLCERLYAEVKNEDVKLMLAESYVGDNKPWKAYEVLKDCLSERNRYKHAQTCIRLKKMAEAERILYGSRGKTDIQNVPAGAAGLYLLGHAQECQGK